MKYEDIEPHLLDYIHGNLEEADHYRVQAYLKENPDFQRELDELEETLHFVRDLPLNEPGPELKINFYSSLREAQNPAVSPWVSWWASFRPQQWLVPSNMRYLSLAMVVFIIFAAGYWTSKQLNKPQNSQALAQKDTALPSIPPEQALAAEESSEALPEPTRRDEELLEREARVEEPRLTAQASPPNEISSPRAAPSSLRSESLFSAPAGPAPNQDGFSSSMPTMDMADDIGDGLETERSFQRRLVLASQVNSTERMANVYQELSDKRSTDDQIIQALIQTLYNDPNPNVRIAAIEALENFANRDQVQTMIVQSLPQQKSALVQLTTLDWIVKYRIRTGIPPIKELLKQNGLHPRVREQAQLALEIVS